VVVVVRSKQKFGAQVNMAGRENWCFAKITADAMKMNININHITPSFSFMHSRLCCFKFVN